MTRGGDVAVLVSGGVESSILCVELLAQFRRVLPIYVRFGLLWEAVELAHLRRYLTAVQRPGLLGLTILEEPIADVYGDHWSTGRGEVPGEETSDDAMELAGRNLLLTAKAAVWCHLRGVEALALGCLATNPFPDSTSRFFDGLQTAIGEGLGGPIRLLRPFGRMHKADVLRAGAGLPLGLTFSCVAPSGSRHCGACNKCAERRKGFRDVGMADTTEYATEPIHA
ncbi:7-cyano-7-deazaguanine synthase [Isosphaeraceae bacterium EP7]